MLSRLFPKTFGMKIIKKAIFSNFMNSISSLNLYFSVKGNSMVVQVKITINLINCIA